MAQKGVELDQAKLSCSICLNLLKDPVTIPCGHNYCMSCMKTHWDREDVKNIHSCPQCRQTFTPRPVLVRNTMLAALVEQLTKPGLGSAAADHCYAGAADVACDVCSGRKLKAVKSCLVCLASYCDEHLQRHYDVAPLQRHKLVDPYRELQQNVCSRHGEVMKMFCRTDRQCICYLCSVDEHKGHDTVTSAAERTERQTELEVSRQEIQRRIEDKQRDVTVLREEVKIVGRSANEAAENSDRIFTELIRLMRERKCDAKKEIRSQEEMEVSRVKEQEAKLERDITELRRKGAEMDELLHTDNHNQFLLQYPSVSQLSEDPQSSGIEIRPLSYFDNVTTAVSRLRNKLKHSLREGWANISLTIAEPQVLLQPEPRSREGLMQCPQQITLDPNTVNGHLTLSKENKRVTNTTQMQNYPRHPDRFSKWCQVLSTQSLTGRSYWEVEWTGSDVRVGVTYKNIKRDGIFGECLLGFNDKSWVLHCNKNTPVFRHNWHQSPVPGPVSSTVGVFLDHAAGVLSFYSVSDTMTLIHRVQTTFAQPLYAGLFLGYAGDTAHFLKLQ